MSKKFSAIEAARRHVAGLQALSEFFNEVESVASLEQAAQEAKNAHESLSKRNDQLRFEIKKSEDDIAAAKVICEQIVNGANGEAANIIAKAVSDAELKLSTSHSSCKKITDDYKKSHEEFHEKISETKKQLNDLLLEIKEKSETLEAIKNQLREIAKRAA